MVAISPVFGPIVNIPDETISLIVGPYPHDVGPFTYVYGAGMLATLEPAAELVAKLQIVTPLLQFTRPDGSPAWIKASAVTAVFAPQPVDVPPPPAVVHAVIMLGRLHQAVRQPVDQTLALLRASGAHL